MSHEELVKLCGEVASLVAPVLHPHGISFMLVVGNDEGWAYALRGETGLLRLAVHNANQDLQSSPNVGFGSLKVPQA